MRSEIQQDPRWGPLLEQARQAGAGAAAVIPASAIVVEERFAALCAEPRCPHYGLATSCPPHVSGPDGFRELQRSHTHAVVFKLDVDSDVLLSPEVLDLMRLLHGVASTLERCARDQGFTGAKAFVGGSCKVLFCGDHAECSVLAEGDDGDGDGDCRYPELAHPSMSGFGVNVSAVMEAAGWTMHKVEPGAVPQPGSQGTICGLMLVG